MIFLAVDLLHALCFGVLTRHASAFCVLWLVPTFRMVNDV